MKFFVVWFSLLLLITGCRSSEDKDLVYREGEGEEVKVCIAALPSSLDPHFQNDWQAIMVLDKIYDSLVKFDKKMRVVPSLAKKWENLDFLTWKFDIISIKFHNSKNLTAKDVVFSFLRAKNSKKSHVSSYLVSIDTVWSEGDSVFIKLKYPLVTFLNRLPFVFITPVGDDFFTEINFPIGTDKYRYVGANDGGITLENIESVAQRYPKKLVFIGIPEVKERMDRLIEGVCDISVGSFNYFHIKEIERQGYLVKVTNGLAVFYLEMNLRKPPFNDRRVRNAISLLIDREKIVASIFQGLAVPVIQMASPEVFGYIHHLTPPTVNVEKAKKLLSEAGYPNGFSVTLIVSAIRDNFGKMITKDLMRGGIDVKVRSLKWEDMYKLSMEGKLDFHLVGWLESTGDIGAFYESMLHTKSSFYGQMNNVGYSNPEIDNLIEKSSRTTNLRERQRLLERIAYMFLQDMPYIPLVAPAEVAASKKGIVFDLRPDGMIVDIKLAGNL